MKICPVADEMFHAARQRGMTKITVAFRNFANAPKNRTFCSRFIYIFRTILTINGYYCPVQHSPIIIEAKCVLCEGRRQYLYYLPYNTGRFIMYSGITKIYNSKTVGHLFIKPVQIEGTSQKCFSQKIVFHRSSRFCR
jgi:hypothetical protein